MTVEETLALNGKIACGAGGEGVTITKLSLGDGFKKGTYEIRLAGFAKGVLLNPNDPNDGADELTEAIECSYGLDLESTDKQKFYDDLNNYFNIQPPLVDKQTDDGDEPALNRFVEGAEDSVFDQIVGKQVYWKLQVKEPTDMKYAPRINTYLTRVRTREPISKEGLNAIQEKLKARKKAKEAELASAFG